MGKRKGLVACAWGGVKIKGAIKKGGSGNMISLRKKKRENLVLEGSGPPHNARSAVTLHDAGC